MNRKQMAALRARAHAVASPEKIRQVIDEGVASGKYVETGAGVSLPSVNHEGLTTASGEQQEHVSHTKEVRTGIYGSYSVSETRTGIYARTSPSVLTTESSTPIVEDMKEELPRWSQGSEAYPDADASVAKALTPPFYPMVGGRGDVDLVAKEEACQREMAEELFGSSRFPRVGSLQTNPRLTVPGVPENITREMEEFAEVRAQAHVQGGFCGTVDAAPGTPGYKSPPKRKRHYAGILGDKVELVYAEPYLAADNMRKYDRMFGPFRSKDVANYFIACYPARPNMTAAMAAREYNLQREREMKESLRD